MFSWVGDNAQDLREVSGLTGKAADVEAGLFCVTHRGVFQQPLIFVSRLKG